MSDAKAPPSAIERREDPVALLDRFINGIKAEVKKTGAFNFSGESAVYWIARFSEVKDALEEHQYAAAEHEHLGCHVAKTGIYAESAPSQSRRNHFDGVDLKPSPVSEARQDEIASSLKLDRMEEQSLMLELCHQLGATDGESMVDMLFAAVKDALRYRKLRSGGVSPQRLGAAQVVGDALDRACDGALSAPSSTQQIEPVCWRREWDGDVSDLGMWVYADSAEERDEPLDRWQPLYEATPPAMSKEEWDAAGKRILDAIRESAASAIAPRDNRTCLCISFPSACPVHSTDSGAKP